MSRIRSKDTKPELMVRRILHSLGYRYRLHVKELPGKPDIVLKKFNAIIFIHGCFWHLHEDCNEGRIPNTRRDYWEKKLTGNKIRDDKHIADLKKIGWRVIRIWECEIEKFTDDTVNRIINFLENK